MKLAEPCGVSHVEEEEKGTRPAKVTEKEADKAKEKAVRN